MSADISHDLVRTCRDQVHAVRGVSFEVDEGQTFDLLGPSGAGKTATIGMLNTTVKPTSGPVPLRHDRRPVGPPPLHDNWGLDNATTVALLSLLVLGLYSTIALALAVSLFSKSGTS
jgi:ABC-type polysaccharide/polyol phosphate transport system ATPase subunit